LDGSGLRPGLRLTTAAREESLERWLTRQGLDPATVDPQRDFDVESFFEGGVAVVPEPSVEGEAAPEASRKGDDPPAEG
jgi:hypothetical protein